MAENCMYALGSNACGQLGIGHRDDVNVPMLCRFILRSPVRQPSGSGSSAVTRATSSLPLVSDASSGARDDPTVVASTELPCGVRKIVAGGNHTLVLLEDGAVYAAGNPEALGETISLEQCSSGSSTDSDSIDSFRRVAWTDDDDMVVDCFTNISATWSASFFVVDTPAKDPSSTSSGAIYACGKGEKGELGLGNDIPVTKKPKRVVVFGTKDDQAVWNESLGGVTRISGRMTGIWSSVTHTMTSFADPFQLYGWGPSRKGQLGQTLRDEKAVWRPRRVVDEDLLPGNDISQVDSAALGRDFSLVRVTSKEQDQILSKWRLLGGNTSLNSNRDHLTKLLNTLEPLRPGKDAMEVDQVLLATWSNLYHLDSSTQRVKGVGKNRHGQLPPDTLPGLSMMATGSEHCVGWTAQETLISWGWGEHGNCGRSDDQTGYGWSVITVPMTNPDSVIGISAGCATTFVWAVRR